MKKSLILAILTSMLSACGQTGPLYMPPNTTSQSAAPVVTPAHTNTITTHV